MQSSGEIWCETPIAKHADNEEDLAGNTFIKARLWVVPPPVATFRHTSFSHGPHFNILCSSLKKKNLQSKTLNPAKKDGAEVLINPHTDFLLKNNCASIQISSKEKEKATFHFEASMIFGWCVSTLRLQCCVSNVLLLQQISTVSVAQGRIFLHLRGGRSGRLLMKLRVHEYFCNRVRYCFLFWFGFSFRFLSISCPAKPAKASLCNKGQMSDWDRRRRPWDFKVKADVIGRRAGRTRDEVWCITS